MPGVCKSVHGLGRTPLLQRNKTFYNTLILQSITKLKTLIYLDLTPSLDKNA